MGENGGNGESGILADIGVAVGKALARGLCPWSAHGKQLDLVLIKTYEEEAPQVQRPAA